MKAIGHTTGQALDLKLNGLLKGANKPRKDKFADTSHFVCHYFGSDQINSLSTGQAVCISSRKSRQDKPEICEKLFNT